MKGSRRVSQLVALMRPANGLCSPTGLSYAEGSEGGALPLQDLSLEKELLSATTLSFKTL